MDYSVGSLSELISGKKIINKPTLVIKTINKKINFNKNLAENSVENHKTNAHHKKILVKRKTIEDRIDIPTVKLKKRNIVSNPDENNDDEKKLSNVQNQKNLNKNATNAERRIKWKNKKVNSSVMSADNNRTIFIGNVPLNSTKAQIKKLCSKYGSVESVRFRSVPVADPRIPKKVAMIKKEFHPDRSSFHSYIKFSTSEEALKALELNGQLYKEHHLRVTMCETENKADKEKAIFVGNISFGAEEDDLWKVFETVGSIVSVRIIRDRQTGLAKGFGYINFENADSVELALQMDKPVLKNRELNITRYSAKVKTEKKKKEKKVEQSNKISGKKQKVFQGSKFVDKKKKKKKLLDKSLKKKKLLIKQVAPKSAATN